MASETVIVDSGGANISSLMYALQRLNHSALLTTDAARIRTAGRVILPGVGAARDAMERLQAHNLVDLIRGLTQPVLGICLGMQLLMDASEEEDVDCLRIIPGVARKLPATPHNPVPNMGWCRTSLLQAHALVDGIEEGEYFYFLHSYAVPVMDHSVASAMHAEPFSAILSHRNFLAAQFHPERSATAGSRLLANFLQS